MSATLDPAIFASAEQYHEIINYLNVIALTALLYDHFLTFGDEVKYIWNRKMTPFNVLFLINRYLGSIAMICYVVGTFLPFSVQESLYPKFQPGQIAVVQTYPTVIIAEAILILRVYAVYQRNKWILALLILVWLTHIGIASSILAAHKVRLDELMNISYALNVRLGLSFFIPAIIFDGMVAGFLTIGLYRRFKRLVSEMTLVNHIMRDGLLYFFAVFGTNIVWLIIGFRLYDSRAPSLGFAPMYTLSAACVNFFSANIDGCLNFTFHCRRTTTTMIGRLTLSLKAYQMGKDEDYSLNSMSMRFAWSNPLHSMSTSLGGTA